MHADVSGIEGCLVAHLDTVCHLCCDDPIAVLRVAMSNVDQDRREVFVALIAPIGINLDAVGDALKKMLKTVSYEMNLIRLTDVFKDIEHQYVEKYTNEYDRYVKLIAAGDKLCRDTGSKDIMALYGIEALKKFKGRSLAEDVPHEVVHVFRQIKRTEEVETLRRVFGRTYYSFRAIPQRRNGKTVWFESF
jgi:hypothetical protein